MEQYHYLLWALAFLALWFILFLYRKDTRTELSFVSFLFGLGGLASQRVYVTDWWQPITLTRTSIGIEDFIIGFAIGGIAAVIYEDLYHKRLRRYALKHSPPIGPGFFLLLFPLIFLCLFFLLNVSSFYATVIALVGCTGYMLATRRDLIADSFFSGICMMTLGVGAYLLILWLNPSFIRDYWYLPNEWYAALWWGVPIGEYLWYFLVGAYIGPLYEYLKHFRLVPARSTR